MLRGDDGFGPAVVRALECSGALPPEVCLLEVGIGGIALVHELLEGCGVLIVVDAVDRGGPPGTLYVLEPEVPASETLSAPEHAFMATDLHEVVPGRVLLMAHALGVLPPEVRIVGCQPAETEEFSLELSPVVERAVPEAVRVIRSLLHQLAPGVSQGADREH